MKTRSEVFDKEYFTEDVRNIVNPLQNMAYIKRCLQDGELNNQLMDISSMGDKVYFVWKRSAYMNDLYDKWCKHEL